MLTVYCPRHGAEVLIPHSGIDAITNTADGIEVRVHCVDGWHGTVRTGRRRARAPHPTAA